MCSVLSSQYSPSLHPHILLSSHHPASSESSLSLSTMSSTRTQATEAQGSPQSAGGFLEPPSYFYIEYGASFGFLLYNWLYWYLTPFPCQSCCWVEATVTCKDRQQAMHARILFSELLDTGWTWILWTWKRWACYQNSEFSPASCGLVKVWDLLSIWTPALSRLDPGHLLGREIYNVQRQARGV